MCSFGSCKTRFEFLSQFRNAFECFVTQVQTHLPKTKCVWPMKINVICTVQNYRKDIQYNDNMDFNSDREPTSDDSSCEIYEPCSDDVGIISKEGAIAVPRPKFERQITDY